jgi:ribose transport system permease protein
VSDVQAAPRRRINFGFDRFSGLYVWALLIVVFGLWIPNLFLSVDTFQNVLSNEAITSMMALAVIVPIAAGVFDLTIASVLSVSACWTAWALTTHHGVVIAVGGALVIGVIVGLVNAFIVVRMGVDPFISTLAMSSVLAAVAYIITGGTSIPIPQLGYSPFLDFGRTLLFGLPLPVYYVAVIALVMWWVLDYTPAGRYFYAVGGNPVAARLAGVRTGWVITYAFIVSGVLSAFAGVIVAARLGIADPAVGVPYLLPAFSAAFLGATQIRPGRMNVPGTLIAILLLATGVKGLQLVGAPYYATDMFNGLALIVAVALAARSARKRG